jgi:hypothetical protein
MPDDARYAFEKVPHGRLAFKTGPGKLFPAVLSELQAYNHKVDGQAVLKLSDLGNCPDDEIARMIPAVVPNCQISLVDDHVYGQPPLAARPFELFPIDLPAAAVFNQFNGMTTVAEASANLAAQTGWEPERAFAYTRGLFLWLVLAGICLPTGT